MPFSGIITYKDASLICIIIYFSKIILKVPTILYIYTVLMKTNEVKGLG